MARYFLRVIQHGEAIADPEGDEYPDLEWAKSEAVATAKDIARLNIADALSLKDVCIEVQDETGHTLSALCVQEVLDNPTEPGFQEACAKPD